LSRIDEGERDGSNFKKMPGFLVINWNGKILKNVILMVFSLIGMEKY
jgi:hypothetical protein